MEKKDRKYIKDESVTRPEKLPEDFYFAMRTNGYFLDGGRWDFDSNTASFHSEFDGLGISFFGSDARMNFFNRVKVNESPFIYTFQQERVTETLREFRKKDENLAKRLAFIFGGVVYYYAVQTQWPSSISETAGDIVKFSAEMAKLGDKKSAEAIATSTIVYLISKGSMPTKNESSFLKRNVFRMAETIEEDPIIPFETEDLGLSQVFRLKRFLENRKISNPKDLRDAVKNERSFDHFPTVGAEFHFLPSFSKVYQNFMERVAILNMSQYQKNSYIQLSRTDTGVIEIRMNPSIYPTTIANWYHMKLLLPELNKAFFTITLNRKDIHEDFDWTDPIDESLLRKLRALGMLTYANIYGDTSDSESLGEISFGEVYLGQTARLENGEHKFSGRWGGNKGHNGQLSVYAGYGENFPHLAYYLSMALVKPEILSHLSDSLVDWAGEVRNAIEIKPRYRKEIFKIIKQSIKDDQELNEAHKSGRRIADILNP